MAMQWKKIIRADDDEIKYSVLEWAGARDIWDADEDMFSKYDFIEDILKRCNSVHITIEEYDLNFPGRSGFTYLVETNDPKSLRFGILYRLHQLKDHEALKNTVALTLPSDHHEISSKDEIITYLTREAAVLRSIRVPGGYGAFAIQTARRLDITASRLSKGDWTQDKIASQLLDLHKQLHSTEIKKKLEGVIHNLMSTSSESINLETDN